MRRVALADIEVGGETIRRGDWVYLVLAAAHRDPAAFADPDRLDISRYPNPHRREPALRPARRDRRRARRSGLRLDEATSHLDSASERLVQEGLRRLMRDRTSLVIADRLSTVIGADLILVLDRGRIVERGTHAELIQRDGFYAELHDLQIATP